MHQARPLIRLVLLAGLFFTVPMASWSETLAADDFSAPGSGSGWAEEDAWDGAVAGGVATVTDGAVFRALAMPLDTSALNRLRLSFDFSRTGDAFAGVSFYDGDEEVVFFGRPFLADNFGINFVSGALETGGPPIDEAVHEFVVEIDFGLGINGEDLVRAFIDPVEDAEPDVLFEIANAIETLTQLRIASNGMVTVDDLTLEGFRREDTGVDQFQLSSNINQAISSVRPLGQTWTVRETGLLSAVELSLFTAISEGDLRLDILDANDGWDPAAILGTVTLSPDDLGPSPMDLDLDERTATVVDLEPLGILAAAGDQLGVRLTSAVELPDFFALRMLTTGGYPGGDGFIFDSAQDSDAAFKTYMTPQAVPCGTATATNEAELAAAIEAYNTECSADTIYRVTVDGTVTLTGELPTVANGNGATFAVEGGTIDGGGAFRSFQVLAGRLQLADTTLRNGNAQEGGAVRVAGGSASLHARGVSFLDNRAQFGGAVEVLTGATAWIEGSLFSGNSATVFGGALEAFDPDSTVTVLGTTFVDNSSEGRGGAVSLSTTAGRSHIANSTFLRNQASGLGGGLFIDSDVTIVNSTMIGNRVEGEGGGAVAKQGGTLELYNNILAGSVGDAGVPIEDCSAPDGGVLFGPGESNLIERDLDCDPGGDRHLAGDPLLAPGAGFPPTLRPLPGSPALDAGADDLAVDDTGAPLDLDARGQPRFFGAVDLGAVERQPVLPFESEVLVQYWPDESDEEECAEPGFSPRCLRSPSPLLPDRIAQLLDAGELAQNGLAPLVNIDGSWPVEAPGPFAEESFLGFTITPEPGVALQLDRLEYDGFSYFGDPGPGPSRTMHLRTSLDGFVADVASAGVPGGLEDYTLDFDLSSLPRSLEGPVEFRLYPTTSAGATRFIDLRGPQLGRAGLRLIGSKELLGRELAPTRFDDPPPDGCFPDDCSLREATIEASMGDVATRIELVPGTYTLTISPDPSDDPASGDLDLDTSVPITIAGAGMDTTTILASGEDRVLETSGVRLIDLTIRGGLSDRGGGLNAQSTKPGTVTLKRVRVADNESLGFGGGLRVIERGTSIEDSILEGNRASNGSAVSAGLGESITLRRTTVRDNTADFQAPLNFQQIGTLRMEHTTVTRNTSDSWPGGLLFTGGAGYLSNITVSNNVAGGSGLGGAGTFTAELHVSGSTIAGNTSPFIDGFFLRDGSTGTLIGNVFDDSCLISGDVTFFTDGNVESGNGCGLAGPRDQIALASSDLELVTVAADTPGAPSLVLGPGSAAIGNASDFRCNVPDDQLDQPRNPDRCDAGAVQAPRPYCRMPMLGVPDGNPDGVADVLRVSGTGDMLSELAVHVAIEHQERSDLALTLTHEETGTSVMLVDGPRTTEDAACGPGALDTVLADGSMTAVDDGCAGRINSIEAEADYPLARYHPTEPLAAFDDGPLDGTWILEVVDLQSGGTGTLGTWCLLPRVDRIFRNGFEGPE